MSKISPYLSIYKFPITALSSISNRISGIYITGLTSCYIGFNLLNDDNKNIFYNNYNKLNNYSQKFLNNLLLYPFGYHIIAGLRHLIWDLNPKLLTNSKVAYSSKFIILFSIIPTTLLEYKLSKINR